MTFTPSTTNAETVTLNIANSTSTNPVTVTLMGMGLAAVQTLEFSPSNLVFADQRSGSRAVSSRSLSLTRVRLFSSLIV